MQTTTNTLATITGGILAKGLTDTEDLRVGDLLHATRNNWPTRIIAIRNVRGGRRITDENGYANTYRYGRQVPTAVLIGGEWV